MNFSDKLKELRQSKGISQAKLAEEIFASKSAVAKWENGLGIPSDESLELLAKYFNVSEEEQLENKENEEIITSKNQTIENQKIIIGLLIGLGVLLLIVTYIYIESIRDHMTMIIIGIILNISRNMNP